MNHLYLHLELVARAGIDTVDIIVFSPKSKMAANLSIKIIVHVSMNGLYTQVCLYLRVGGKKLLINKKHKGTLRKIPGSVWHTQVTHSQT